MKLSILPLTHPVAVSPSLPHPEPISYSISPCPPSPLPRTSPLAARAPSRTRRAAAQGGPRARRAHCRRRPHRHLPGRRHAARLHPHRGLPRRAAVLRQGGGEVILKLVGRLGAAIFVLEWAALALAFELRLDDDGGAPDPPPTAPLPSTAGRRPLLGPRRGSDESRRQVSHPATEAPGSRVSASLTTAWTTGAA